MSDVLFITPNKYGYVREEPVGSLLLATILKNKGLCVDILQFHHFGDMGNFSEFIHNALEMISSKQPKIVSFYTRCDSYHISLTIAQKLKERYPDVWVVFGGQQADITAADTLCEFPAVDMVCCGEGETTVYPLFLSLLHGEPDWSIPGLVYRTEEGVVTNPRPALFENLDDLPDIDYSFFQHSNKLGAEVVNLFPIDVGRGCPFGCTYCSTKTFWGRKYRLKSPERIVREVKHIHEQFGITNFAFEHDMFTMKRTQVIETCRLLKALDFPVTWRCSARVDCLDEELIDIMVDAGLKILFVGVETGSPRMQKLINKNLKLDSVLPMLTYIHKCGIKLTASFIYGFPEETEEDVAQTLSMIAEIKKIRGIQVQAHLCTFLPGTELSARYQSEMTLAENYSDIVGTDAMEECRDMILAHPKVFNHLLEYKTPLRTRLRYFSLFVRMWEVVRPVYQYLAEKYPNDRLLDMYDDFVRANGTMLEQAVALPSDQQMEKVCKEDRFFESFCDDAYYDVISDLYRLRRASLSDAVKEGGSVTDVYCISPLEMRKCDRVQDFVRGVHIVTFMKSETGSVEFWVKSK